MPYMGPFKDYPIELPLVGSEQTVRRVLRVWVGYVMVIHQNCEIEYADQADSRMTVAPLVSRQQWPIGPWDLISRGELPGFLYLHPLSEADALRISCPTGLPEMCVAFAGTPLLSRGIVKPARVTTLRQERLADLQSSLVRFFTVRGWASGREVANLTGKTIVEALETVETVPGPSRLAKIVLRGDCNEADDELSVTWGLRPAL